MEKFPDHINYIFCVFPGSLLDESTENDGIVTRYDWRIQFLFGSLTHKSNSEY